ncbi:hypothetical protein BDN72DRAFT_770671 [Pluteus cervinus]|uniref:Uncharacterized protein n=1 Tax=Pluteus cervinus TaxID=181527 RepID=A0ACD3AP39_9AGAR|nr:hypothetical protein BDN72DRAFT_770671 [Pluteus cervinus]
MVDGVIERLKGNPNSIDSTEPGRYDKYIDQLPNLVLRWQQDTLSHYAAKIPRSHTSSSQVDSSYDVLSLATSVFECLNCSSIKDKTQSWQAGRTLIGWRALNGHLSCTFRKWKDQLEYSNKGAEAAQSLVILAGLSPQRALATDLDSLDYRFTCGNCEIGPTGRRGSRGHKVWTWRECVYHFIQMNRVEDPDHQTPRWNRLSPEMSAYIKRRETPGDVSDLSWSCLHCPSAWGSQEDRSRTIQHVVESHQIQRPKDDVDYTHSMRGPSSPRVAVGLSEYPTPEQYYCLRCDKPRGRLYAHQSIILHLLDKSVMLSLLLIFIRHSSNLLAHGRHEIRDPEEGCEYACIPLYDAHYPVS